MKFCSKCLKSILYNRKNKTSSKYKRLNRHRNINYTTFYKLHQNMINILYLYKCKKKIKYLKYECKRKNTIS